MSRFIKEVRKSRAHAITGYNRRRESEMEGFDEQFAPTCDPVSRFTAM